jgi:cellulose biosynthesis protein BcsQ
MQIVSFMNMKGGVGKTTLAVNVAYALAAQHGKTVLGLHAAPSRRQLLLADQFAVAAQQSRTPY